MSTRILVGALALCRREVWLGRQPMSTRILVAASANVVENFDWDVSPVSTRILIGALALCRREC